MAYMNKNNFDIIKSGETPGGLQFMAEKYRKFNFGENYFHVDDMIALPVQALNRKGYTTEYCCSDHPFYDFGLYRAKTLHKVTDEIFDELLNLHKYSSYITFKLGVTLPSLPPGYTVDDTSVKGGPNLDIRTGETYDVPPDERLVIRKHFAYDDNDPYAFMRDVLDAMEQLYQWALGLPDAEKVSG